MAKVSELFRRTQSILDDSIDNIDMVDWFNQCQSSISDFLYMPTRTTILRDNSGGFPLPSNYNSELIITSPTTDGLFDIVDGYIEFTGSTDASITSITVRYNRLPADITNNPEQIPDIHAKFHDIYVSYAAMQSMQVEDEQDRYDYYEKDYLRTVANIKTYYGKLRPKPSSWGVIR